MPDEGGFVHFSLIIENPREITTILSIFYVIPHLSKIHSHLILMSGHFKSIFSLNRYYKSK
jgi:hypothetical protein